MENFLCQVVGDVNIFGYVQFLGLFGDGEAEEVDDEGGFVAEEGVDAEEVGAEVDEVLDIRDGQDGDEVGRVVLGVADDQFPVAFEVDLEAQFEGAVEPLE